MLPANLKCHSFQHHNQNGHSSTYVGIILIIKDMHILQLLIALVDGYAYIILDMDQLLAKTLSPIAGIYL